MANSEHVQDGVSGREFAVRVGTASSYRVGRQLQFDGKMEKFVSHDQANR